MSAPCRFLCAALPLALALSGCFGPTADGPDNSSLGLAPLGETTVEILKGAPPSERIRLGPYGVAFGRPGGVVERALFADDSVREELADLAGTYGPFDLPVGTARVRFRGRGGVPAPWVERRRVAEWALFVVAESTGLGGREPAPVLYWQRGGEGEACDGLGIDRTGGVRGGSCAGGGGAPRRLATAELERLYAWFDRLGPFATSWLEGPPDGRRTLRLVFAGAGRATASPGEREEITAFASALATELKVAGSPRFAAPPSPAPLVPLSLPARAPIPPPVPPFVG
ncbi:MAG: hypothetical protein ABJC13_10075 [Acidobacteriota bacterium]